MEDVHGTLDRIRSSDRSVQGEAYEAMITATDEPVDWAYEVWDQLVEDLGHTNNRVRSIASQILANLAKSDPERRIVHDFPALLEVTRDERFVTARHCLQSLWKVGVAGEEQREVYRHGMVSRFDECPAEKNGALTRVDILQSLRDVYDHTQDASIRATAEALIEREDAENNRKKLAKVLKR
jgi:flagellar biosynthesis regulator FlaF